MSTYFLSDIHLKPFQDARMAKLCSFLEKHQSNMERLFLLGDIFDFWMGGHKIWQKRYEPLVQVIHKLRKQGTEVFLFEGNHDIHVDYFWAKKLGVTVYDDPKIFDLEGYRVRIEHGDLFNPDDKGYLLLRWFLRTPFLETAAVWAPGWLVAGIADWGSSASHKRTSKRSREQSVIDDIKRRTHVYAQKRATESEFDLLIMGHTHIREDYELEVGTKKIRYINLGSWFEPEPKALVLEKGQSIRYVSV